MSRRIDGDPGSLVRAGALNDNRINYFRILVLRTSEKPRRIDRGTILGLKLWLVTSSVFLLGNIDRRAVWYTLMAWKLYFDIVVSTFVFSPFWVRVVTMWKLDVDMSGFVLLNWSDDIRKG